MTGTQRGLVVLPIPGLPEVRAGDDVAALLVDALSTAGMTVLDGDVLVVTSKIISKALGLRAPAERRAALVMEHSQRVVAERQTPGGVTRIVEASAGPVMAAAGIDASNTGNVDTGGSGGGGDNGDTVLLLPDDPDAQARALRAGIQARLAAGAAGPAADVAFGVIISDTAGRAWRMGQTDFALGAAGVRALEDLQGTRDDDGRPLAVTARALADELASAADLVKGKTGRVPAVVVRGAVDVLRTGSGDVDQGARALIRSGEGDWFRYGHVEAVRSALGVPPGGHDALDVGLPGTIPLRSPAGPAGPAGSGDSAGAIDAEEFSARIDRACRLATHDGALPPLPARHPRAHTVSWRPDLTAVTPYVLQTGVRLVGEDPVLVGLVAGRLVAALAAESIPARLIGRADGPPTWVLVAFE